MSNLLFILVLCGGQSTEHDISLLSARNVVEHLLSDKYIVSLAYISREGTWYYYKDAQAFFSHPHSDLRIPLQLFPGQKNAFYVNGGPITVDCIFPVLHGTNGEDGAVQGLFELLQLPYVSADCLSSAIAMDKDITKRLLRDASIPVVDWVLVRKNDHIHYTDLKKKLGDILFIKPNSLGSSVGVHNVTDQLSFEAGLQDAFRYDEYVLIEKAMIAREIECSVLGNENPRASLPGEIINHAEFYTFDAKYVDEHAAMVKTPADLPSSVVIAVQTMAIRAFRALRILGMARVDFFLTTDDQLYINEVNTIPGFTNISMYPKNWEVSGLSYAHLLDELIQLGMQRFAFKQSLNRVYKLQLKTKT